MTRIAHLGALLAAITIPALGWFVVDWSAGTTLVVYWFETAAGCLLISARVLLHQRWAPRRGHFKYAAPTANKRGVKTASFVGGFTVTTLAFCAAHAVFLGAVLLLLHQNRRDELAAVDWRSVGLGCLSVLLFLLVDFVLDLMSLRRWSFWQIEQLANRGLSRIIVIHLTLIFGFAAIAFTNAPGALFGVFVVLKTLASLSTVIPQYEPTAPPEWLSRIMNRVPNVHPGQRFEDFWAKDRSDETERRKRNEEPWATR